MSIAASLSLGINSITQSSTSQDLTLSGTVILTATAPINVADAGQKVIISSVLGGGAFGITKSGLGTLELNAATNTFSGDLTISAGTVTLGSGTNPLAAGGIISMGGGTLLLNAGIDATNWNRAITVTSSSTIVTATGGSVIDHIVTVNANQVLTLQGTQTLEFTTGITGAGGLTLTMTGGPAITISGTAANYTGDTDINNGVLTTGAADKLTNSGTYTLANSASASISTGAAETIGSLAGGALSTVVIGGVFTINQTTTTTYSGIISGGHAIDKIGVGILKLAGANSYGGTTSVTNGTLLVNGTQVGTGAYTVFTGATLGGTGTINGVASINGGGMLKPGDPATASGVGTLTTTKAFTFHNLSKYYIDINAGSGDKLVVNGNPCTVTAGAEIRTGTATGTLDQQYIILSVPAGAPATFTVNNTGLVQTLDGTDIRLRGVAGFAGVIYPIPTLNEWGLILFGLLVASFAILSIRRKNNKTAF